MKRVFQILTDVTEMYEMDVTYFCNAALKSVSETLTFSTFEKAFEWAEKHPDADITGFAYVSNELDSLKAALNEEEEY